MTKAQALKLAKAAYENRWPGDDREAFGRYLGIQGQGDSWEEACRKAKLLEG